MSSASEAVLATMSSVQCNMASGININSIRTENNDAIHGLARTVGQELRQLRTDSIRFDNTRTRYVEAGKASLQFVGESYEVIVTGNMTFESRLHFASRTVAKTFVRSMRPVLTRPHKPNRNVLITGGLGAIGKGYSEHVDTDAENRANLQLLGRSGRSKTFDGATLTNVCVCKCDSSFTEDVRSTLIYDYDEILHASGILKDMSLRKHTERTVRSRRRESRFLVQGGEIHLECSSEACRSMFLRRRANWLYWTVELLCRKRVFGFHRVLETHARILYELNPVGSMVK